MRIICDSTIYNTNLVVMPIRGKVLFLEIFIKALTNSYVYSAADLGQCVLLLARWLKLRIVFLNCFQGINLL